MMSFSTRVLIELPHEVFGEPGRAVALVNTDTDRPVRTAQQVAYVVTGASRRVRLAHHLVVDGFEVLDLIAGGGFPHIFSHRPCRDADIGGEVVVTDSALLGHVDRVAVRPDAASRSHALGHIQTVRAQSILGTSLVDDIEHRLDAAGLRTRAIRNGSRSRCRRARRVVDHGDRSIGRRGNRGIGRCGDWRVGWGGEWSICRCRG